MEFKGFDNFVRNNPYSDRFDVIRFHSLEFWCNDAVNTARRFGWALGMNEIAHSNLATNNPHFASSVMNCNNVSFVFTAPYNNNDNDNNKDTCPLPNYNQDQAFEFIKKHGVAVRAVCITVSDAELAYNKCVEGTPDCGVLKPTKLVSKDSKSNSMTISEVKLVGDVVIRWISGDSSTAATNNIPLYLPFYEAKESIEQSIGITRVDHCVSNVPKLADIIQPHLKAMTGFHEFAEFTAEDVGTVDSGLNSVVMASNNEAVLLPFNEPTFGTKRQSQIQTYLVHNNGAGIQHIALKTNDIFRTIREMRTRGNIGGFEFMPAPNPVYYSRIPDRIGKDTLTADQLVELQKLGILADKDDQGVLLQIFTKPVGDRPTLFIEIIQRIGCDKDEKGQETEQRAACGGFGKGNFSELFKSIEEYEKQLNI